MTCITGRHSHLFASAAFILLSGACSGPGAASQTWDYEVMGVFVRSLTSSVPQQYSDFIEQDQSVNVVVHEWDRWEPRDIVENLRANEQLRQAIAQAEVITYDFAFDWQDMPQTLFVAGFCGGSDGQDCLREVFHFFLMIRRPPRSTLFPLRGESPV